MKPHNNKGVHKKKKVNCSEIHLLGQYEIVREDEEITPSTGCNANHLGDGKAKGDTINDAINNENTINKITITVY